jgi:hypothetical protein
VFPDRPLGPEIVRVLEAGYARGADVWHLATALYLADDPADLPFLTLDVRQRELARALGSPRRCEARATVVAAGVRSPRSSRYYWYALESRTLLDELRPYIADAALA